jgi:hypothetical protein
MEQERLFLIDPDERDRRRQEALGRLAVPTGKIRGRRRESSFPEFPPPRPQPLPEGVLRYVNRNLVGRRPLLDEITRYYTPGTDQESIKQYMMGGNRRNHRKSTNPDTQQEINEAKRRQTQHVADQLQRQQFMRREAAILGREALVSVIQSVTEQREFNESAAHYASAMIEDYGICLREQTELLDRVHRGFKGDLPVAIEQVGLYAEHDPEIMRENPVLLEVVLAEQEKRVAFWGEQLDATVAADHGRSRLTQQDVIDQHSNNILAASFALDIPPV